MVRSKNFTAIGVALVLFMGGAHALDKKTGETAQDAKDREAAQNYLKKAFPGKKWQSGPHKIESKAIQQSFGPGRYLFVHSAIPLPPGAPLKQLLDKYQQRVKDIRENYISLALRIDAKGKLTAFKTVQDFQQALKPVNNEKEAKTAAAAALALFSSDRVAPGPIPIDKVTVRKTSSGYLCTTRPTRSYSGSALFDNKGVLQRLSKTFTGPFPP